MYHSNWAKIQRRQFLLMEFLTFCLMSELKENCVRSYTHKRQKNSSCATWVLRPISQKPFSYTYIMVLFFLLQDTNFILFVFDILFYKLTAEVATFKPHILLGLHLRKIFRFIIKKIIFVIFISWLKTYWWVQSYTYEKISILKVTQICFSYSNNTIYLPCKI